MEQCTRKRERKGGGGVDEEARRIGKRRIREKKLSREPASKRV